MLIKFFARRSWLEIRSCLKDTIHASRKDAIYSLFLDVKIGKSGLAVRISVTDEIFMVNIVLPRTRRYARWRGRRRNWFFTNINRIQRFSVWVDKVGYTYCPMSFDHSFLCGWWSYNRVLSRRVDIALPWKWAPFFGKKKKKKTQKFFFFSVNSQQLADPGLSHAC